MADRAGGAGLAGVRGCWARAGVAKTRIATAGAQSAARRTGDCRNIPNSLRYRGIPRAATRAITGNCENIPKKRVELLGRRSIQFASFVCQPKPAPSRDL